MSAECENTYLKLIDSKFQQLYLTAQNTSSRLNVTNALWPKRLWNEKRGAKFYFFAFIDQHQPLRVGHAEIRTLFVDPF